MEKENRQSNFELLRIISMVLILMSHCDDFFGLADLYSTTLGANKIITDWLHMGGQVGVGCFVLISGYFMVEQNITFKKIMKLEGEVWVYSIGLWLVWSAYELYKNNISAVDCIKESRYAFFPILSSHYWFATAYVILMILSPFLNKLIFALNRKEYRNLLISAIGIFVILKGTFPNVFVGMSEGRLIPMFIMYFIAGYIKRFRTEKKNNASEHFTIALIFYLLLCASCYINTLLGTILNKPFVVEYRDFYRELNSPLVVVICVELFFALLEMQIAYNKVINTIAGCTFGVYLIHQNRWMNSFIQRCFPVYKETRPLFVFLYSIVGVLIIYVVCTVIDYVRAQTVGKLWNKILNNNLENLQDKVLTVVGKLSEKCQKARTAFYDGDTSDKHKE